MKKITLRTLIAYLKQEAREGRDVTERLRHAEAKAVLYGEETAVLANVPDNIQVATRCYEVEPPGDTTTVCWSVYNSSSRVVWGRLYENDVWLNFPSHEDARAFIAEMGRAYGVEPTDRVFTHY